MDSHHNALPRDFVFWPYVPPLEADSAAMWSESAGHAQPALDFGLDGPTPVSAVSSSDRQLTHVSFLQDIGWDSVATLQNLFQDGVIHAGVKTTSAAAFNTAFNYSDSRPVSFNDVNLVSTPCPHCQPKTLTYFVAQQGLPDPWQMPTPSTSHS
ncbi:hypothetical protein BC827DRAFT_758841 [Russula dissimulans]|jgi:hypothetical protein|nr:hypothetical protein BC827DRAFT_758841 [Russula dissimulans]